MENIQRPEVGTGRPHDGPDRTNGASGPASRRRFAGQAAAPYPFSLGRKSRGPACNPPSGLTLLFFMVNKTRSRGFRLRGSVKYFDWILRTASASHSIRRARLTHGKRRPCHPASRIPHHASRIPHHASRIPHPASNLRPHPNRRLRSRAAARKVATMPAVPGSGMTVRVMSCVLYPISMV